MKPTILVDPFPRTMELIFSKDKVENLLKKTFLTISYSSTVIEDSICNKIPVILFDQWKRYKNFNSSENPAAIIPVGIATIPIPDIEIITVQIFPIIVIG